MAISLTPSQQTQRDLTQALMGQVLQGGPVAHPLQGIGRLAQALAVRRRLDREEAQDLAARKAVADALSNVDPSAPAATQMQAISAALASVDPSLALQQRLDLLTTQQAQQFTAGENLVAREHAADLQEDAQEFTSGEGRLDREFTAEESLAAREHAAALQKDRQQFTAGENLAAREHAAALQEDTQEFTSEEGRLDRESREKIAQLSRDLQLGKASETAQTKNYTFLRDNLGIPEETARDMAFGTNLEIEYDSLTQSGLVFNELTGKPVGKLQINMEGQLEYQELTPAATNNVNSDSQTLTTEKILQTIRAQSGG